MLNLHSELHKEHATYVRLLQEKFQLKPRDQNSDIMSNENKKIEDLKNECGEKDAMTQKLYEQIERDEKEK